MVTVAPFAIFFGAAATAALLFFSFWSRFQWRATSQVKGLSSVLDRADIKTRPEELVVTCLGLAAILWFATAYLLHPSLLVGLLMIPLAGAAVAAGFYAFVQLRLRKRLALFTEQLELCLRLMASSVRVGLGLRQALATIIEEMPNPSRHEFTRVIGQTSLGVSPYDALDDLAERMPSNETLMMARVIRIQSQTGGDLAKVLEHLAGTIKDRRRIMRKISALTAEGRSGALILALLPVFLATFILVTQPTMSHALLHTTAGHITLGLVAALDLAGTFTINRILQVKV